MNYASIVAKLLNGLHLTVAEAGFLMELTMTQQLLDVQIASWLTAYAMKSQTSDELLAFTKVLYSQSSCVNISTDIIDTCGTGGDNKNLINVSTLTAIVLASLKIPVGKHGNRAVSSKSGSADLLFHLGYPMDIDESTLLYFLKTNYFAFMYAPLFHPAMKHVARVRQDLKIKTVFNLLGPLLNPMKASIRLLGVYDSSLLETFCIVLKELGVKCAMVVHSCDDTDEVSIFEPTKYCLLHNNQITSGKIIPPEKTKTATMKDLIVSDQQDAFQKALGTLKGTFHPGTESVAINVVVAQYLWELAHGNVHQTINEYIIEKFDSVVQYIASGVVYPFVTKWSINIC